MRMPRKGKSNCMGEEVMGGGYVEYGVYKIATRKMRSEVLSGAAARTGKKM